MNYPPNWYWIDNYFREKKGVNNIPHPLISFTPFSYSNLLSYYYYLLPVFFDNNPIIVISISTWILLGVFIYLFIIILIFNLTMGGLVVTSLATYSFGVLLPDKDNKILLLPWILHIFFNFVFIILPALSILALNSSYILI